MPQVEIEDGNVTVDADDLEDALDAYEGGANPAYAGEVRLFDDGDEADDALFVSNRDAGNITGLFQYPDTLRDKIEAAREPETEMGTITFSDGMEEVVLDAAAPFEVIKIGGKGNTHTVAFDEEALVDGHPNVFFHKEEYDEEWEHDWHFHTVESDIVLE